MSNLPSVRMEQLGSHQTNFYEIWYLGIFFNLSRKFKSHYNMTRITGTLHEDQYTFFIIVVITTRHVLELDRPVLASSNSLFKCHPSLFYCWSI